MTHYTPTSPKVSVLMVSHDAEKTVRRAVESLQNQTFGNFELIVVDAGSTDETARLLSALADRDMRVSVAQAGECGRQDALNLALDRARGDYLLVFDADGWADPTMLEELAGRAESGSLELVIGGFSLSLSIGGGRSARAEVSSEARTFPTQHDFRSYAWKLLAEGQLLPASGKLFSRALVERSGARFSQGSGSDHSFVTRCLAEVERVAVVAGARYHVSRGIPHGPRDVVDGYRRLEEEHVALLALYESWGLDGDAASVEAIQDRYIEQLMDCVERICGRGSRMGSADQRRLVAQMIDTDRAQVAASVARPRGSAARAMLAPIRARNIPLVCAQTCLISLIRPGIADVTPDLFV